MPGLTLNTNAAAAASANANANPSTSAGAQDLNAATARPSSPPRPTYSPITPPLNPLALPPRPTYTHSSQQDQVSGIPAPPPEPIDFDTNPDVLALKSAISILQLQRRKAAADMALLSRVKSAALADPEAFVHDLTTGRVGMEGDALFGGSSSAVNDDDDDDDDEEEEGEDDEEMEYTEGSAVAVAAGQPSTTADAHPSTNSSATAATSTSTPPSHPEIKSDPSTSSSSSPPLSSSQRPQPRPWNTLPKPQNVVRCPPINWAQYAVVGDSLDKLHAEQLSRPAQGVPATLAPDGQYQFRAAEPGRQEKLVGVAAPYAPGKDRIDRKPKGPKR
ncbi:hypothetical protein K445DRAFT_315185 [Daldinia sp. EC12]|nr:hypothetical protein K445DRAFT_315185 [Daldinia sp. EC12]